MQVNERVEKYSSTDDENYSQPPATPTTLSVDNSDDDDDSEIECSQQVASPVQNKPTANVSSSLNVKCLPDGHKSSVWGKANS